MIVPATNPSTFLGKLAAPFDFEYAGGEMQDSASKVVIVVIAPILDVDLLIIDDHLSSSRLPRLNCSLLNGLSAIQASRHA